MSTSYKKIAGFLLGAAAIFAACEKEAEPTMLTSPATGGAFVKVVHAAPSFSSLFSVRDTFHLYVGGQKVNGPLITFGGTFPARIANAYAQVPAGNANLKLFFPGVGKPDSIELFSMQQNLVQNRYYSLIVTDSVKGSKDSSRIWLQDNFEMPDPNLYSMRFVHAVMNDTTGKLIDVYSARRNGNIISAYKPGQASNFVSFPFNGQVSDTLIVRRAGTMQELARLNTVTFGHQRVYTVLYRGNGDVTGTATKARTLTFYLHQ